MSMRKGKRGWLAAVAVLALSLSLILPQVTAYAVSRVDVGRECSLTIQTPTDAEGNQVFAELKEQTVGENTTETEIPVTLYRVADIDAVGRYQTVSFFETLELEKIDNTITAEIWAAKAQQAADLLAAAEEAQTAKPDPAAAFTVKGGTGKAEGLSTGMYLVCAGTIQSAEYEYTFAPYLISLPTTDYQEDWQYDVTASLKPEQIQRYGDLVIEKELKTYNASLGDAVFVFRVEGIREGEKVYSNVVALDFSKPGKLSAKIEHIPAGTEVTVTEVYSGASYKLTEDSEGSYKVTILADEEVSAAFANDTDGRLIPGTGVINQFTYNDTGFVFSQEWLQQAVPDDASQGGIDG